MKDRTRNINYSLIIILSFLAVIILGGALLCLPISNTQGVWGDITTSLFTATSATCVTGLTVVNIVDNYTIFGQIIILIMIQVGGLGIMTIFSVIGLIFSKKLSLHSRSLAKQSAGAITYKDITGLLKNILIGTMIFEIIGIILLSIRFIPTFGIKGLWIALFTSVSAFCNAGFDIFSTSQSLTMFYNDPLVILVISGLVIIGGIGFLVWVDIKKYGLNFKKYSLHSKLAIITTTLLLTLGTALFLLSEWNKAYSQLSLTEKLLSAFFQSTTLRTAGFYTIPQQSLCESSVLLCDLFMLIGGTSGSTAGGIKTTTFAILIVSLISSLKGKNQVEVLKRRISENNMKSAYLLISLYVIAVCLSSFIIMMLNNISLSDSVFECISAIGTVGLTRNITSTLSIFSKYILMLLMFVGRIGGVTIIISFANIKENGTMRPIENILIG